MRDNGAEEDQRRHAQRHAATWFMDLLDDQVVAAFDAATEQMIEQADREPADRQEKQQPWMRKACSCRNVEAPQEGSAEAADRRSHRNKERQPTQHGQSMVVPVPSKGQDVQVRQQYCEFSAHDSSLLRKRIR